MNLGFCRVHPRNNGAGPSRMINFHPRYLLLAWLTAVLAGCAHPRAVVEDKQSSRDGAVGVSEITALVPVATRMVIADSQTFFMPLANRDNALPLYPPALLGRRLPPQSACLRVSIDDAGAVMDAAPVAQPPGLPGPGRG